MRVAFTLELYYEHDSDRALAEYLSERLRLMVHELAPHIDLTVMVLLAGTIVRSRFTVEGVSYDVPNCQPSSPNHQALLITNEVIGAKGWAGPGKGCVSKQFIEEMISKGGDPADIVLHEWLHTIEGLEISGRKLPNPHSNAQSGFSTPSGRGPDGSDTWHDWYRHLLRLS